MEFDVINITATEISKLSVVQMKMLRTAQQKKNELYHKAEKELKMYRAVALGAGMKYSSLIAEKEAELIREAAYQSAILADNLLYNMALNEPTNGSDIGGDGGDEGEGYVVDYTLSYAERYVIVRDFYLAIEDPQERLSLYANDTTAKNYLSTYYSTLHDVLKSYSK